MTDEYTDIIVTAYAPLIVRDASACMHYGTVSMDAGAYLEIRVGSRFQMEKLSAYDAVTDNCHEDKRRPGSYPSLVEGETRRASDYHIIITGKDAPDGLNGKGGDDWGVSGDPGETPTEKGGNAPSQFTLAIKELTFDTLILSTGGNGGNGGNGGDGANGYDGESSDGDGGTSGGIGGDGGNGGNGSNGGNAPKELTVQYASTGGFLPSVDCNAGSGGNGGVGGKHGRNGKYYSGSTQPKNGQSGSAGLSGQAGRATITPL
jgi:hypothetical protein